MRMKFVALTLAALLTFKPAIAQEKVWHHGGSLIGDRNTLQLREVRLREPRCAGGRRGAAELDGRLRHLQPDPAAGRTRRRHRPRVRDADHAIARRNLHPVRQPRRSLQLPRRFLLGHLPDEPACQVGRWRTVKAEDVVWTFNKVKELNPSQANYYANVTKAEVTAPGEVTFSFDQTGNRELPNIMGQLIVLPQHWWEGTAPTASHAISAAPPSSRRWARDRTSWRAFRPAPRSPMSATPTTGA